MEKVTYGDYKFIKTTGPKYVSYILNAPEDSVSPNILKSKMNTNGTDEYKIRQKAEYFKDQLENADYFTNKLESAFLTNIPGPVGASFTAKAIMEAIESFASKPSAKEALNALLTIVESIPYANIPIAVIEYMSLAPVIWTNLYNCRNCIDSIQDII